MPPFGETWAVLYPEKQAKEGAAVAEQAVREYLNGLGLGDCWQQYPGSCATVEEAAQQLGTQPGAVGKTICIPDRSGEGRCVLIVTAGDRKLDNQKFRQAFGFRPGMLPADQVEDCVGHPPGGVCPFALPQGVRVYLDASLRGFERVYTAGGGTQSLVGLRPDQLEQASGSLGWVDVSRPKDEKKEETK